ncbi:MAG TPA: PLDc N-terminal domain-containing protein [Panacibacter sp.]|nr:PLDc N-terminal domain-containing protein [Panacibacter sp.]HNP43627.1 PLDc N-terminal domain-containing protein [Panacibacter sp.]
MFSGGSYYYLILALQAICVIHCLRKGKNSTWIVAIIFLPLIGSIAYIFMEMFRDSDIKQVQTGVSTIINPGGSIKKLEQQLKFSDTFNNRVALADAYLSNGDTDKAIDMYKSCLTGTFTDNEYVIYQLILAYSALNDYGQIVPLARKVYQRPQFARSKAHIAYATALEFTGNPAQAEEEFKKMKARFSYFEARYQYGLFLLRHDRSAEARELFSSMVEEESQLGKTELKSNRYWIGLAKDELRKR